MITAAGRGTARAAVGGTPRRVARWAAVAALGMLGAVVPGAASADSEISCPDGGPCLVVKVFGQRGEPVQTETFSEDRLSGLPGWDSGVHFNVRAIPGGHVDDVSNSDHEALSLTNLLLNGVGVAWQQVQYAQIVGLNGTSHDLEQDQLRPAPDNGFVDGLSPSVFVVQSPLGMNYARPFEAADPDQDLNASDWQYTTADPSKALVILVHTSGVHLHPTVTASQAKVRVGTPDTFTVAVPDAPAATGLHYTWLVNGEDTSQDPAPWQHAFATVSQVAVSVRVEGDDGSTGVSQPVSVTVCPKAGNTATCTPPPEPGGTNSPGGGHHHGPHSPTGPIGGNGTHQGTHVNGSPDPQSPTSQPGETTAGTGPGTTSSTGPTSTAPSDPSTRSGHDQGGPAAGRQVSGTLLAASAAFVLPRQKPSVTAAAAVSVATKRPWAWQWKWAGIFVFPLLVGLGMAGESLQLRRRLAKMSA